MRSQESSVAVYGFRRAVGVKLPLLGGPGCSHALHPSSGCEGGHQPTTLLMLVEKLLDQRSRLLVCDRQHGGEQHHLFLTVVATVDEHPQEAQDVGPVLEGKRLPLGDQGAQRLEYPDHPQHLGVLL